MKFLLIVAVALIGVTSAQNFFQSQRTSNSFVGPNGQRGTQTAFAQVSGTNNNNGRYNAVNDNSGRYQKVDDGKYRPDNSGKYSGKYIADDAGRYTHDGREYDGGFGSYDGSSGKYVNDNKPYVNDASRGGPGGKYNGNGQSNAGRGLSGAGSNKNTQSATLRPTTTAAPIPQYKPLVSYHNEDGWKIIRDVKKVDTDGYYYLYETENKILAEEQGRIENVGTDSEGMKAKGFYEYVGDDGKLYHVDYTADENGFVPKGDHIPTPPPIPADIQRALDYVANLKRN